MSILDVDECVDGTDCSHICNNTVGGFICNCFSGYELDTDNRTCIGTFCIRTLHDIKTYLDKIFHHTKIRNDKCEK